MRKVNLIVLCVITLFFSSQLFAAKCGDVNSDNNVNIVDALLIAQAYVGTTSLSPETADVNSDKNINIVDALLIAQYYVGAISELPGCSSTTPIETPNSTPGTGSGAKVDFDLNVPMGWAAIPGYGLQTTTGGGGGEVVNVSSHGDLKKYASGTTPYIIRVNGTISGSDIVLGSNKTIIGKGADAKLKGFYLNMNGSKNIIIRNLEISGGTDAIAARHTTHLWIDHINTFKCSDGLIDITRESDYYTVSWVRFSNHRKTMLLNGGSKHMADKGKLNGTVHHCWFDGSSTRNPRTGFGKIHVLNNLYNNNGYCVGLHSFCKTVVERNYFKDTSNPIMQMYTKDKSDSEYGSGISVDNIFDNSKGNDADGVGFPVNDYYLYDFMMHEAKDVPQVVKASVGPGAEYGEIGLMPIPGQGAANISTSSVSWKSGTQKANSYIVYFGTTATPPEAAKTSSTSYNPGSLKSNTQYYWRVDQVTSNGTVQGKLWTFKTK